MSISNVPSVAFTEAGLSLPLESQILAGVFADFNEAFGGNLNPALETPQGQLISSLTAIIGDKNAQLAEVINQIDPDTASGVFQDAIARIYFINRRPATATTVDVVCQGVPNTLIPVGVVVEDSDGNRYQSLSQGMIASDGKTTMTFTALNTGAVICPAQSILTIYKGTVGLENVSNPIAGVTGRNMETRAEFEARRRQSVAINAHGSVGAIYGAVASVADVSDVLVTENYTSQIILTGATNYPMPPHSIMISVLGGNELDIATAIFNKKDLGCDMAGNTGVLVTDPTTGQQYAMRFNRPNPIPIYINVQLAKNSALPSDIVARVKRAVLSAFNGTDGGIKASVGTTLYASRFYGGIATLGTGVAIAKITLSKSNSFADSVIMGIDQIPVLSADNINVTIG